MKHTEISSTPHFTATEEMLLQTIGLLEHRIDFLEQALRTALPMLHGVLPTHQRVTSMIRAADYKDMVARHGTELTRNRLTHRLSDENNKFDTADLENANTLLPQRITGVNIASVLTEYYSHDTILEVFSKIAVDVEEGYTAAPIVNGSGWQVVRYPDGLVVAYYLHSQPNQVQEMMWQGSAERKMKYSGEPLAKVYIPGEDAWASVSVSEYVINEFREAAIAALFSAQGHLFHPLIRDGRISTDPTTLKDFSLFMITMREMTVDCNENLWSVPSAEIVHPFEGMRYVPRTRYDAYHIAGWQEESLTFDFDFEGKSHRFTFNSETGRLRHDSGFHPPSSVYGELLAFGLRNLTKAYEFRLQKVDTIDEAIRQGLPTPE